MKIFLAVLTIAFLVLGYWTRYQYKNHKWITGTDLTSRKQARIEAGLAVAFFACGMATLYAYAAF